MQEVVGLLSSPALYCCSVSEHRRSVGMLMQWAVENLHVGGAGNIMQTEA